MKQIYYFKKFLQADLIIQILLIIGHNVILLFTLILLYLHFMNFDWANYYYFISLFLISRYLKEIIIIE